MNTIGAFVTLIGIALLYARFASLNMAELGRSLAAHDPGAAFVSVAFLFIIAGFVVKAAAMPFHFWLTDAHAVAPTPVCILFSGVMVELGVYAIARIYWTIFADSFAHHVEAVRILFLVMGSLTAVIAAVHCFGQRQFKRLLALSTISHVGLMFVGLALLHGDAFGGLALYVLGHGLVKGTLFICAGMLLHRFGSVDEHQLRGRGKNVGVACLFVAGAIGLAGLPPFATFHGEAIIDSAAEQLNLGWLSAVALIAETLTAAAVLRVTGRIFLGWGTVREASSRGAPYIATKSETGGKQTGVPATMWVPAVVLLALAIGIGSSSASRHFVLRQAAQFQSPGDYRAAVLEGQRAAAPQMTFAEEPHVSWRQGVTLVGAMLLAYLSLSAESFGRAVNQAIGRAIIAVFKPLRRLQSGMIGDYVAWFVLGMAIYGGVLLLWHH